MYTRKRTHLIIMQYYVMVRGMQSNSINGGSGPRHTVNNNHVYSESFVTREELIIERWRLCVYFITAVILYYHV